MVTLLKWLSVVLALCISTMYGINPANAKPELCDGNDNDGDGLIDEDWDIGQKCWDGIGACREQGVWTCITPTIVLCIVEDRELDPKPEDCNGVDDDCNGIVDDLMTVSSCFVKSEDNLCNQGRLICDSGGARICEPLPPAEEVCGNDFDEDCDGYAPPCLPDVVVDGGAVDGGGLGVPCRQVIFKEATCSTSPSTPSPILPLSAVAVVGAVASFIARRRHHKL